MPLLRKTCAVALGWVGVLMMASGIAGATAIPVATPAHLLHPVHRAHRGQQCPTG